MLLLMACASCSHSIAIQDQQSSPYAAPPSLRASQNTSSIKVAFRGAVMRTYNSGGDLDGWLATESIIRASVESWYPHTTTSQPLIDPSPSQLRAALAEARQTADQYALNIIYLGARQNAQGQLLRQNGDVLSWAELFPAEPPNSEQAARTLYILDACHASRTLSASPELKQHGIWFLASGPDGLVYQRDLATRKGYDTQVRHPRSWLWATRLLGDRSPQPISHTGLVWLAALDTAQTAPQTGTDLIRFLERCVQEAEAIEKSSKLREATVPRVVR